MAAGERPIRGKIKKKQLNKEVMVMERATITRRARVRGEGVSMVKGWPTGKAEGSVEVTADD